ncbi:o-succinylbenzoate synthase [Algoriphagus sp. CAU 1675]|uniref:o-succinylbenzoate synthase n=1 Tax=Algoriphagus sp. CAU 1675 TaxID=3032597 RepID=UPI0023DA3F61|nr:o-succinylbenzoate synthase [Algoriphagus sp. CAU 1675]MDF2157031.1 o-succinylbenzoate synthase [Algoriphagus sp. CAU 1675]
MSSLSVLKFDCIKRTLVFRFDAGTSRGVLKTRDVWWIKVFDPLHPSRIGWGESAPLVGLSVDYIPDFESVLKDVLVQMESYSWDKDPETLLYQIQERVPFQLPSIRFGLEMALLDWVNGGKKRFFQNDFYDNQKAIPINGLIWMGNKDFMLQQIDQKLSEGFNCIKLKIGAIDFRQELELLSYIRSKYSEDQITLRVDANGAFSPEEALDKLQKLAEFQIHSIEQPIRAGQIEEMHKLCQSSPIPIALDEELIGVEDKAGLLDSIRPQHIILKPMLLGGFQESKEWIRLAEERGIGWWMTSALESNIGLNAIAQLASSLNPIIPQGLGTGKLYHNNLKSPLEISGGEIHYRMDQKWEAPS